MTQQDFNAAASREGDAIEHRDVLAWARNGVNSQNGKNRTLSLSWRP